MDQSGDVRGLSRKYRTAIQTAAGRVRKGQEPVPLLRCGLAADLGTPVETRGIFEVSLDERFLAFVRPSARRHRDRATQYPRAARRGCRRRRLTAAVSNFGGLGSAWRPHSLAALMRSRTRLGRSASSPRSHSPSICGVLDERTKALRGMDEQTCKRSLAVLRHHLAARGAQARLNLRAMRLRRSGPREDGTPT